jgi:cytochrome c553
MFKSLLSSICGAVAVSMVVAAPAGAADDIEAKAQVCAACHGQNGQPIDGAFPIIFGQQQSFLMKQLHDFRSGDRESPIMVSFAKGLAQEDLRKMAAYLASKPWPARPATPVPAAAAAPPPGIAVCQPCHQQNFEGGAPAPRLAGQSYQVLLTAMNSFADDTRTNNLDMPRLMKALSPAERDAIARYLSSL